MIPSLDEANAYFATRYGATGKWPTTDGDKTAVLTTAENDLLAAYRALSTTDAVKRCIFEQAFARLLDPDIDTRAALQAQGVASAGMVKESYSGGQRGPFVCDYARAVLGTPGGGVHIGGASPEVDDSEAENPHYSLGG